MYAESRKAQQLVAKNAMFHAGSVQLKHAVPAMLVRDSMCTCTQVVQCKPFKVELAGIAQLGYTYSYHHAYMYKHCTSAILAYMHKHCI